LGIRPSNQLTFFVMLDPEFIDDEETKLLAVTTNLKNKVDLIKDFEIKD
ncbi:unnamed protein product, partial [marine sediment metagenome]